MPAALRAACLTALRAVCLAALLGLSACQLQPAEPGSGGGRADLYRGRDRYLHLEELGVTQHKVPGVADLQRGYYNGDLTLTGQGLEKRGAGIGESVIDGHVTIEGSGWTLVGFTIRGDVIIRGDENDVSRVKVLGRVVVDHGLETKTR